VQCLRRKICSEMQLVPVKVMLEEVAVVNEVLGDGMWHTRQKVCTGMAVCSVCMVWHEGVNCVQW